MNCSQYQVIVDRRSTVSNLTCDSISTDRSWLFGPFNNVNNNLIMTIYYDSVFRLSIIFILMNFFHLILTEVTSITLRLVLPLVLVLMLYQQVIGSQLEYPLLVVNTPIACTQQYFTGCQNCQDDSCTSKYYH